MSQPKTTSQKPKPPSTAEKNLSRCRYLPRSTPSMSETATFTLPTPDLRMTSTMSPASRSCPASRAPLRDFFMHFPRLAVEGSLSGVAETSYERWVQLHAMKTTYRGSCHCGRVRFEVSADLDHVRVCDCSI